jgi:hypothetical protein
VKKLKWIIVVLLFPLAGNGQSVNYTSPAKKKDPKGWFYGSFGWHRIFYTPSTIHFRNLKNANYDFAIYHAKAMDDNDMDVGHGIDAPQWSLRFGFVPFSSKSWGLEWSYEHAKYILKRDQRVHIKGQINGTLLDKDTTLHSSFIEFEHTDGANYYMLSLVKRKPLFTSAKNKIADLLFKAGAGPVIPRTDSKIMGNHYNKHYHISGFVTGAETSLRYEVIKAILIELSVKTAYALYSDILLWGNGRARQHWFSLQVLFTVAAQFPVKNKAARN